MMKTVSLTVAVLAASVGDIAATPASAQYPGDRYEQAYQDSDRGRRDYDRDAYRRYDRRGDDDRRAFERRRDRGDRCSAATGTILGAIAGGLLGNSVAGRGDRGVGTVLGAGAGAFAGRAIDQSGNPRDCR